jgi:2-polyprenyl-3-methyl-5-hydroxy-6-metoxy-1,4-benzoquinol methylase
MLSNLILSEGLSGRISLAIEHTCWVCGSARTSEWKKRSIDRALAPEDLQITDSRYGLTLRLLRCADCGFTFAEAAEVGELVQLYEQLEDNAYEEGLENRAVQMRWILKLCREVNPQTRTLLEIGSGIGLLVNEARKAGFDATGVEPSRSLVAAAKRILGVELLNGTFPHPSLEGRRFDVVLVVDVIEHVSDPVELLRNTAAALTDEGLLVVVTPDAGSLAARLLGHRWWHFRLAHVGYFNSSTMRKAAANAGLEIVGKRRAVWFFPVQYLATRLERYLPVAWLNRRLESSALFRKTITLNLFDSWVFLLRRKR